jgi:hypothetical protein
MRKRLARPPQTGRKRKERKQAKTGGYQKGYPSPSILYKAIFIQREAMFPSIARGLW